MARLKDASKQDARKPFSPSSDDDAATQQLLTESHSPLADLPPPSAVLGANLLNAARINPPSSIPECMVRKHGPGKLKRVSMKRDESSKQNLATRGDPYEIELSPEKGRYALPEKINHKPLKILRKRKVKKRVVDVSSAASAASPELLVHKTGELQVGPEELVENLALAEDLVSAAPDIRSSPPELAPPGSDTITVSNTRQETPPNVGDRPTDAPDDHADAQATSKRKSELDHGDDHPAELLREQRQASGGSGSSKKTQPQVRIPVRRKLQEQNTTKKTGDSNPVEGTQESVGVDLRQDEQSRPVSARQKPPIGSRRKRANETAAASQQLPARKRKPQDRAKSPKETSKTANTMETESAPVVHESEHESEHESNTEESGSIVDEGSKTLRPTRRLGGIEAVFEFLNLEARPGKCQTKLATSIRRICNVYNVHLQDSDIPTEQVAGDANELQETLRQIGTSVQEGDRRDFKDDAYSYVFRALTSYLEALYTWLKENCGTVTESLEAMRILSPLIHQILAFKDTIADWNVSIPHRSKGDRIIKGVDISLIAHLRQVDKTYRKRLSRLETTEQYHEQQEDFARKMKEREEEEDRKAKSLEARTERWKRWQDLHIKRMLCEPEPRRRQKLIITRLEDLEERDANGIVFERLPVFKSRSAPPHRQTSTLDASPEWTEQEETALLDGLKHCAGPQVFEKIFIMYCRPTSSHPLGGHLRNRSVAEIVTRAAQFRSDLQKLYQDNGWEVEDWIAKIPILP